MSNMIEGLNAMASVWSLWMTQMSWQVAILAGVVWMVSRLFRRAPASLRHLLWLVVVVRLLIPPALATPLSVGQWLPGGLHQGALEGSAVAPPTGYTNALEAESVDFDQVGLPEGTAAEAVVASAAPVIATTPAQVRILLPAGQIMLTWAVGALLFLSTILIQYQRFARRISRGMRTASPEINLLAEEQAYRLGLRRKVKVLVSPHVSTPVVFGVVRPVILLPEQWEAQFTQAELSAILAHELAHVKRHDIPIAWLVSLVSSLYWFHPALWVAVLHLRRERELSCDDMVLSRTEQDGKEYASVILRTAEVFDGAIPAGAGFVGLIELADNLLHRIRSAGDVRCGRRMNWAWGILLAGIIAFFVPMGVSKADTAESPYGKASSEVRQHIEKVMGAEGLWVPDGAFDALSEADRGARVMACLEVLSGDYGRDLCSALADAGALADGRLKTALLRIATHRLGERLDNRPRWMAVAALGRLDDVSVVPALIPLVDYYNKDTARFAQGGLARLTGENFGANKQAWAEWWNQSGKGEAIDPAALPAWDSPANPTPETPDASGELARYAKAAPDVQEFLRHTAASFGRSSLWLADDTFSSLTPEAREEKVIYIAQALEKGDYGRQLCTVLAEAGALQDDRLLPGLIKVASYHREDRDYDCRPKWMAVAALGRQDNLAAVPHLIPLVDHGNLNTRMWARGGLVRLTGQTFGDDKQAWGAWWNATGNTPLLSAEELVPWKPVAQPEGGKATMPEIVSCLPAIGASDVDPATTEIRVTFDQDMGGGFSWTGGGDRYPKTTGKPRWEDKRTCVLPVALEAGKVYRVGINSKSHKNFRGANGVPARNRVVYFATQGADPAALEALTPPRVTALEPANNAQDVPPSTTELRVTFDKPMGGGFSWVQNDAERYPETTGSPSWNEDHTVCTLPVRLAPDHGYMVGLNSDRHINFQSASGVPLDPVAWEFRSGAETGSDAGAPGTNN